MSNGGHRAGPGSGDEVDVLYVAGQRVRRCWLLVTGVDGKPGGEFTARHTSTACGGDVLVRLTPAAVAAPGLPAAEVGVFAVLAGRLVRVAAWRSLELEVWPEVIRPCAAFAIDVFTELQKHGADLGAGQPVDLGQAVTGAGAGIPLRATFSRSRAGSLLP